MHYVPARYNAQPSDECWIEADDTWTVDAAWNNVQLSVGAASCALAQALCVIAILDPRAGMHR